MALNAAQGMLLRQWESVCPTTNVQPDLAPSWATARACSSRRQHAHEAIRDCLELSALIGAVRCQDGIESVLVGENCVTIIEFLHRIEFRLRIDEVVAAIVAVRVFESGHAEPGSVVDADE